MPALRGSKKNTGECPHCKKIVPVGMPPRSQIMLCVRHFDGTARCPGSKQRCTRRIVIGAGKRG